jgi:hypothetical protein
MNGPLFVGFLLTVTVQMLTPGPTCCSALRPA